MICSYDEAYDIEDAEEIGWCINCKINDCPKSKKIKGVIYCVDCKYKNTNRCPAYDTQMRRTSLRITFCNCGEQ